MTKLYTRFLVVIVVVVLLVVVNIFDLVSLNVGVSEKAECQLPHNGELQYGRSLPGDRHQVNLFGLAGQTGSTPFPGGDVLQSYVDLKKSGSYKPLTLISDRPTTKHTWPWYETQQAMSMCSANSFSDLGPLPNVSAVICFHDNENISVVLHTVHSIIQRTPPELLHEIILVDDHSIKDDLQGILTVYCSANFGSLVKIHRSPTQLGLIKARLKGINMATGEVIVIMDSHVEVQRNWIKPLLYEIKKNGKTLAASYLDWITPTSDGYDYKHGGTTWKTYFDWALVFGWQAMSETEIRSRKSLIDPIKVPVTIGTIYAIGREFFHEIGAFDPGMELWGGENIDLPVRVWLCGGQVLQLPCSRAGHIEFPKGRDYRRTWDSVIHKNYKRFAEVWMGDYKKYVYWQYKELPSTPVGDLSQRMALKQQCTHDFGWFLKNVFPEIGTPDINSFAYGGIRNHGTHFCLHSMSVEAGMWECEDKPSTQGFYWNTMLELRFPMHVFNARSTDPIAPRIEQLEYTSCYNEGRSDQWIHWQGGPLYNVKTGMCAEPNKGRSVTLRNCTDSPNQKWSFVKYTAEYEKLQSGKNKYGAVAELLEKTKKKLEQKLALHPSTTVDFNELLKKHRAMEAPKTTKLPPL